MSELEQYLYLIRPARPEMLSEGTTPREEAIIDEHFNYLKALTEQGVVILVGRTQNNDETTFGIVIFEAKSIEAASRIMNDDPAVKNGIMVATLFPYRIALLRGY